MDLMSSPETHEEFTLHTEVVGALPIVNHFLDRMGVGERLRRHLSDDDPRLRLTSASVIGLVVRNIIVKHTPVYAIAEWAQPFEAAALGLTAGGVEALNDDRVGRMLDRLFAADRATLITETVLGVIRDFHIEVLQLHNDSTTITLTGVDYEGGGEKRGGKLVVNPAYGHNKDYRPDLKQLLFILTVSADGAVPIAYRVMDGNTSDDTTHIPTWDELRALVGHPGFLYVADSKLCSTEAMGHIAAQKGRFVTVIPHGRREDKWFKDWIQTHAPAWEEAFRRPGARTGDPDQVWRTFEAPVPSTQGYRVIWVHSTIKAARDAAARTAHIEAGLAAIEGVQARLASPKSRLKDRSSAEKAATAALATAAATRWVEFTVTETAEEVFHQERRGRPGSDTRYRRSVKPLLGITAAIRADRVSYDAIADGCFPLITNDTTMTPPEVLAAYRYQPNLERRNHLLKGPQEVAPVFLETPHRIEALLLCHFLAMLTEALIEREIRTAMKEEGLAGIPLYPELRDCPAPSAPRILDIFSRLERHHLMIGDAVKQVFDPTLTPLHHQVLALLHVPDSVYGSATAG
jgi:transposase